MTQQDLRPRPSPLWYLVTVVLWIAALVIAVIAIKPVVAAITSDLTLYPNRAQVAIPAEGATIYATDRPAGMTCTATDAGGKVTELDEFDESASFEIDPSNAPKVSAVANTPDGFAAGTYVIACDGLGKGSIAVGDRLDIEDIGVRFLIAFGLGGILGLIGLIVLIVMLVKRHNSKKRIREAQTNAQYQWPPAGGGYPPPGQYGGYPPPGGSGGYTPPPAAYGSEPPTQGYGSGSDPAAPYGSTPPPPPYGSESTPESTSGDDNPPPPSYPPPPPSR